MSRRILIVEGEPLARENHAGLSRRQTHRVSTDADVPISAGERRARQA